MLDIILQPDSLWFWLGFVILLVVFMRIFERKNLFKPTRKLLGTPSTVGLEYEEVHFFAEDDVGLHGWWIPHPEAKGTVLYCHGNAFNVSDRLPLIQALHATKVNVFIFDYRGYGKSRGFPSEKGTYKDARAAYEVVRARYEDTEDPPVVIYGCSLGGAVATQLALDKKSRGLVLESTFTSAFDMAQNMYPWLPCKWLLATRYDTRSKVKLIQVPTLLAHSREDDVIPFSFGQELYAQAAEPKVFFELKGGHSENSWEGTPGYTHHLQQFFLSCFS